MIAAIKSATTCELTETALDAVLESFTEDIKPNNQDVINAFLNSDLRTLEVTGLFPENISKAKEIIGPIFIQINKAMDISKPSKYQSDDSGNSRILSLQVTDGLTRVNVLETKRIPSLSSRTLPGTKAILQGKLSLVNGQILINDPSQITILGGHVNRMVDAWRASIETAAARAAGVKFNKDDSAPKFQPFNAKNANEQLRALKQDEIKLAKQTANQAILDLEQSKLRAAEVQKSLQVTSSNTLKAQPDAAAEVHLKKDVNITAFKTLEKEKKQWKGDAGRSGRFDRRSNKDDPLGDGRDAPEFADKGGNMTLGDLIVDALGGTNLLSSASKTNAPTSFPFSASTSNSQMSVAAQKSDKAIDKNNKNSKQVHQNLNRDQRHRDERIFDRKNEKKETLTTDGNIPNSTFQSSSSQPKGSIDTKNNTTNPVPNIPTKDNNSRNKKNKTHQNQGYQQQQQQKLREDEQPRQQQQQQKAQNYNNNFNNRSNNQSQFQHHQAPYTPQSLINPSFTSKAVPTASALDALMIPASSFSTSAMLPVGLSSNFSSQFNQNQSYEVKKFNEDPNYRRQQYQYKNQSRQQQSFQPPFNSASGLTHDNESQSTNYNVRKNVGYHNIDKNIHQINNNTNIPSQPQFNQQTPNTTASFANKDSSAPFNNIEHFNQQRQQKSSSFSRKPRENKNSDSNIPR